MSCKNCRDCGDCPPARLRTDGLPPVGGSDTTRYLSLPNASFNGGGETWRSAPIVETPVEERQPVVVDPTRVFYVSCWNGQRGPQFAAVALLGPFDDHQDALNRVDECRRLAQEADPKATFYAFGTCSNPREEPPLKTVFRLNENGEVVL